MSFFTKDGSFVNRLIFPAPNPSTYSEWTFARSGPYTDGLFWVPRTSVPSSLFQHPILKSSFSRLCFLCLPFPVIFFRRLLSEAANSFPLTPEFISDDVFFASLISSFIHSITPSFIHSSIHPSIQSSIHSLVIRFHVIWLSCSSLRSLLTVLSADVPLNPTRHISLSVLSTRTFCFFLSSSSRLCCSPLNSFLPSLVQSSASIFHILPPLLFHQRSREAQKSQDFPETTEAPGQYPVSLAPGLRSRE